MTKNEKKANRVNNSNPQARRAHETRTKPSTVSAQRRHTKPELQPVQVIYQTIHQVILQDAPRGLIGEKVVYSEKFLKVMKGNPTVPLPECGYFTITSAVLQEDGRVMVALYPYPHRYGDGTHIYVENMRKYKND